MMPCYWELNFVQTHFPLFPWMVQMKGYLIHYTPGKRILLASVTVTLVVVACVYPKRAPWFRKISN